MKANNRSEPLEDIANEMNLITLKERNRLKAQKHSIKKMQIYCVDDIILRSYAPNEVYKMLKQKAKRDERRSVLAIFPSYANAARTKHALEFGREDAVVRKAKYKNRNYYGVYIKQ